MNNPKKICLLLSSGETETFLKSVQKYLEPVLQKERPLNTSESKCFGMFCLECVQKCTLKMKEATGLSAADIDNIVSVIQLCSRCYVQFHDDTGAKSSDPSTLVKLIFYAINSLRNEVEHKDRILMLAGLEFELIEKLYAKPLPGNVKTVAQSCFACFWNTANKMTNAKEKGVTLLHHIKLRHASLLFLCAMADHEQLYFISKESLGLFMHGLNSKSGLSIEEGSIQFSQWMIQDVIEKVLIFRYNWNDPHIADIVVLRLKILQIEHMMDLKCYAEAKSLAEEILKTTLPSVELDKTLCIVAGSVCKLANSARQMLSTKGCATSVTEGNSKLRSCIEEMDFVEIENNLQEITEKGSSEELSTLHTAFKLLVQQVAARTTDMPLLHISIIQKLSKCMDMYFMVTAKLLSEADPLLLVENLSWIKQCADRLVKYLKNTSEKKVKSETSEKMLISVLSAINRKLMLLFIEIQTCDAGDVDTAIQTVKTCVETMKLLLSLKLSSKTSLSKHIQSERSSFVSVCNKLAQRCSRLERSHDELFLYKETLTQMEHSADLYSKDTLARLYVLLADCHRYQGDYQAAMVTIVRSLKTVSKVTKDGSELDFSSAPVTLLFNNWVKIKRDAAGNEEKQTTSSSNIFHISLLSAIRHNKVELLSVPDHDILQMELLALQKMDRRLYKCEFYILKELLNFRDFQRAEHLTNMATCVMATRKPFSLRDSGVTSTSQSGPVTTTSLCQSALELVNEALSLLEHDDTAAALATKAIAFFQKFDITEEMTVQEENSDQQGNQSVQANDTDQSGSSSGAADQSDKGMETKTELQIRHTLTTEEQSHDCLKKALLFWEKFAACDVMPMRYDVIKHLKALMSCMTRLTAIGQPILAWKAIKIAHVLSISQSVDSKLRTQVLICMVKALINLGSYAEAGHVLNTVTVKEGSQEEQSVLLLRAEIDFFNGKRPAGMASLKSVLCSYQQKVPTKSVCLYGGLASRLLSMLLSFPTSHVTDPSNHNLLSLADQAVRRHASVLNCIEKTTGERTEVDLYLYVTELLQSLLNSGRLYRLVGDHVIARGYLIEGLRLSQKMGLPRWSCEFMLEHARLELKAADVEKAMRYINDLHLVLSGSSVETGRTGSGKTKLSDQSIISCSRSETVNQSEGLKNTMETDSQTDQSEKNKEHVDLNKLAKSVAKRPLPVCSCGSEVSCGDPVRHRLCAETGLIVAEFLSQCSHVGQSVVVLKKIKMEYGSPYENMMKGDSYHQSQCISSEDSVGWKTGLALSERNFDFFKNGEINFLLEAHRRRLKLELDCKMAELYLKERKMDKMLAICLESAALQKSGYYDNVLHSDILLAELVLWESMSVLDISGILSTNEGSTILNGTDQTANVSGTNGENLESQPKNPEETSKKRVTFLEDGENNSVKRKVSLDNDIDLDTDTSSESLKVQGEMKFASHTPSRRDKKDFSTPMTSSRKNRKMLSLQTPLSIAKENHRRLLDFFMEDSDEEPDQAGSAKVTRKTKKKESAPAGVIVTKNSRKNGMKNVSKGLPVLNLTSQLQSDTDKIDAHCDFEVTSDPAKTDTDLQVRSEDTEDGSGPERYSVTCKDKTENNSSAKLPKTATMRRGTESVKVKVKKVAEDLTKTDVESVIENYENKSDISNKHVEENLDPTDCQTEQETRKFFKCRDGFQNLKEKIADTSYAVIENGDVFDFNEANSPRTVGIIKKGKGRKVSTAKSKPVTSANKGRTARGGKNKTTSDDISSSNIDDREQGGADRNPDVKKTLTNCDSVKDRKLTPLNENGVIGSLKDELHTEDDSVVKHCGTTERNEAKNNTVQNLENKKPLKSSRLPTRRGRGKNVQEEGEEKTEKTTTSKIKQPTARGRKGPTRGKSAGTEVPNSQETSSKVNDTVLTEVHENMNTKKEEIAEKKSRPGRGGRGRRKVDEIESERGVVDSQEGLFGLSDFSTYIVLENIEDDTTESSDGDIEILRGDTEEPKKSTTRRKQPKKNGRSSGTPSDAGCETQEVSRSSRLPSLTEITDKINCLSDASIKIENNSPAIPAVCKPSQSDVICRLETAYQSLRRFPPCPLYSEICQLLALVNLDVDRSRSAFLLTEAMAVTFRHRHMVNLERKMRKQREEPMKLETNDKAGTSDAGSMEPDISSESPGIMDFMLLFDADDNSMVSLTSALPKDWTVYQISVVQHNSGSSQMLLTRFVNGCNPVIIKLPGFSTPQNQKLLTDFNEILAQSRQSHSISDKALWWKTRENLDKQLKNLVGEISSQWIAEWCSIFKPRELLREINLEKELKALSKKLKANLQLDAGILEVLILCGIDQLEKKPKTSVSMDITLRQCVTQLLGNSQTPSDTDLVISVIKKLAADVPKEDCTNDDSHVVLILDKSVQQLPWECLPQLRGRSVSRMPCLSYLSAMLKHLSVQENSVYNTGVRYENTFYMIDCDGNLPRTREQFCTWFENTPGWKGIVGRPPTVEEFAEAITERDMFIYCSHGCGGQYIHGDDLSRLQDQAVAILMGCSSGRLKVMGQLEPYGMVMNYFLSGCPCVVGNLWDVTDKDIDRFLTSLLQTWENGEKGMTLSAVVARCRQVCRMEHLTGAAPVVYGLPVTLRK